MKGRPRLGQVNPETGKCLRACVLLKGLSPVEMAQELPRDYLASIATEGGLHMKLRWLMIALVFCSQLVMATPTCRETCLARAEAAAKACATLPLNQRGACLANAASVLNACLKGCG